jgi:hypothetical protein
MPEQQQKTYDREKRHKCSDCYRETSMEYNTKIHQSMPNDGVTN